MKTDRISFTSKINFVNSKTFENFRRGKYVDFRNRNILLHEAGEYYTDEVRTCTAIGMKNKEKHRAYAGHYYDDIMSNASIDDFLDEISKVSQEVSGGIIIGGKTLKFSQYSMENFNIILNFMKERIPLLSIFKEHKFPWSETNFHYSIDTDTYTVNTTYKPLLDIKVKEISSKDELLAAYKEIHLAQGDELYINGERIYL